MFEVLAFLKGAGCPLEDRDFNAGIPPAVRGLLLDAYAHAGPACASRHEFERLVAHTDPFRRRLGELRATAHLREVLAALFKPCA